MTQWRIALDADFSDIVFDLTTPVQLTELTLPEFVLEAGTTYFWRVRHIDDAGAASEWSATASFTTVAVSPSDVDDDGVPDNQAVDGSVDLDGNGVPDIGQPGFLAVKTPDGLARIGVTVESGGTVTALHAVNGASAAPEIPGDMPFGLINFRIQLDEDVSVAEVRVYFSEPLAESAAWYKYDLAYGWQAVEKLVQVAPDRRSILLTLTDGAFGDADGVANGVMIDPAGVVVADSPPPPTGGGGDGGGCFLSGISPVE